MGNSDFISGIAVLILSALGYYGSLDFSYHGGIFVSWVLIILAVLGVCLLIKGLVHGEPLSFWEKDAHRSQVLWAVLFLLVYALTMPLLGFITSSITAFTGLSLLLSSPAKRRSLRGWLSALAAGSFTTLIFFVLFKYALVVPLPMGFLLFG